MILKENECYRCAEAIDVSKIPFSSIGNNNISFPVESSAVQPECPFIQSDDRGVWYSVTSSSGHCLTMSTAGSEFDFDTTLTAYKGDCQNLSCVGQNDNWKECESCRTSMITLNPHVSGLTYKLLVAGRSGETGNYSLSITVSIKREKIRGGKIHL